MAFSSSSSKPQWKLLIKLCVLSYQVIARPWECLFETERLERRGSDWGESKTDFQGGKMLRFKIKEQTYHANGLESKRKRHADKTWHMKRSSFRIFLGSFAWTCLKKQTGRGGGLWKWGLRCRNPLFKSIYLTGKQESLSSATVCVCKVVCM